MYRSEAIRSKRRPRPQYEYICGSRAICLLGQNIQFHWRSFGGMAAYCSLGRMNNAHKLPVITKVSQRTIKFSLF
jgi:hypothetical protein